MNRRSFLQIFSLLPLAAPAIAKATMEPQYLTGMKATRPFAEVRTLAVDVIYGEGESETVISAHKSLQYAVKVVALPSGHEVREIFIDCAGGHDPLLPGVRPVIEDQRDAATLNIERDIRRAINGGSPAFRVEPDLSAAIPACENDPNL